MALSLASSGLYFLLFIYVIIIELLINNKIKLRINTRIRKSHNPFPEQANTRKNYVPRVKTIVKSRKNIELNMSSEAFLINFIHPK